MSGSSPRTDSGFFLTDPKDAQTERITIVLPDFFSGGFLAEEPRVNPHYQQVRAQSEAWLCQECNFDEKMRKRIVRADFSYFIAIAAPEADVAELRTLCDWGNWVFPFDDMFDNGHLKHNPKAAREMMDLLLAIMKQDVEDASKRSFGLKGMVWRCTKQIMNFLGLRASRSQAPARAQSNEEVPILVAVHDTVWLRIKQNSSKGVQLRFAQAMASYCAGALQHVKDNFHGKTVSLEGMLETRRESAGVMPLFALVEYAHGLKIPDEIFENEAMREFARIGTDLVVIHNDIISYVKEESEDVVNNMVAACRIAHQPAQTAFNSVAALIDSRHCDWAAALTRLPSWGEAVDADVQKYIRGVQDIVLANLHWSFKSERYLGSISAEVKQSGRISVLRDPPYLREITRKDFGTRL